MNIIPAILVPTYDELLKQIEKIEPIFDYAQLDIMDGQFVDNKSFNYNERKSLENFFNKKIQSNIKFELHLMVNNPLIEMAKWKKTKNIFRIVFHIEAEDDTMETIATIRKNGWQSGIAINPETNLEIVSSYLDKIDVLQFMTVEPGKQGNPFLKSIGKKIKRISHLANRPTITVDGGINQKNIKLLKSWGVDVANIGSELMMSDNIEEKYNKLKKLVQ